MRRYERYLLFDDRVDQGLEDRRGRRALEPVHLPGEPRQDGVAFHGFVDVPARKRQSDHRQRFGGGLGALRQSQF